MKYDKTPDNWTLKILLEALSVEESALEPLFADARDFFTTNHDITSLRPYASKAKVSAEAKLLRARYPTLFANVPQGSKVDEECASPSEPFTDLLKRYAVDLVNAHSCCDPPLVTLRYRKRSRGGESPQDRYKEPRSEIPVQRTVSTSWSNCLRLPYEKHSSVEVPQLPTICWDYQV